MLPWRLKVTTSETARGISIVPGVSTLSVAAVLAAIVVIAGSLLFLSKDLADPPGETLHYPATDFVFAFGSGHATDNRMRVDTFANGYALLSSGPVSIKAGTLRALNYNWLPPKIPLEAAFFWRRSDDAQNVMRTDITIPGTSLIDLSAEPEWHGEIIEFGFLLAGIDSEIVEIGEISLIPDNLKTRLQLTWHAWSFFETWSQQSINFIYGGHHRQIVALPLLVAAWLLCTLLFLWLILRMRKETGSRSLLIICGMLFLVGWVLLDIRWAANNIKQIHFSVTSEWQGTEQQRLSAELDGKVYQYVQRLKTAVLSDTPKRILILRDEDVADYYLLRAKYHLLPHSVLVAKGFAAQLKPGSVDFVMYFGQPGGIIDTPGWNGTWQQSLLEVDSGEWGVVYKTR
jgi:hypothetical protein